MSADPMTTETAEMFMRQRDEALAEVERLKREGSPGVMHPVDKAFYDLAIKERDFERVRVDNLRRLLAFACNVDMDCDPHDAAHSTRDGIARLQAEVERLRNVERAARQVDAFVSREGPPFRFDGTVPVEEAQDALLSLHDYLNDVERARAEGSGG